MPTDTATEFDYDPPTGWGENPATGQINCPHRDIYVCGPCADTRPEVVTVLGQHFWVPGPDPRTALAGAINQLTSGATP